MVMMLGVIQLDGPDGHWTHFGAIVEDFICYIFLFVLDLYC